VSRGITRRHMGRESSESPPGDVTCDNRPAPTIDPRRSTLHAEDQLAVQALVHRYADAVCRNDEAMWAACWAPEGRWDVFSRALHGIDDIVAYFRRAMSRYEAVIQLVHNGAVDTAAGVATGTWYISEQARAPGAPGGLLLARYDDEYVCADGSWRFARRTLVPNYVGPPDLSGTFSVRAP
jgi:hypothetical protein